MNSTSTNDDWAQAADALAAAFAAVAEAAGTAAVPVSAAAKAAANGAQQALPDSSQLQRGIRSQTLTAVAAANVRRPISTGLHLQSLAMGHSCCAVTQPLLEQLPVASLTHLQCWQLSNISACLPRLCELSSLRSLLLQRPSYAVDGLLSHQVSDNVLAPLSALRQLTRLQLPAVRKAQLLPLQLPYLQQLHVKLDDHGDGAQLQLSHLTALQVLTVAGPYNSCGLAAGDELPAGLQELYWTDTWTNGCSLQPLLGLAKLQKLRLMLGLQPPTAEQVAQLSVLSSLQEVALSYCCAPGACGDAAAATAWPVLPLLELGLQHIQLSSAALHNMQQLLGLTSLDLGLKDYGVSRTAAEVSFGEVASMLLQMPALQRLGLYGLRFAATVVSKDRGGRRYMYHDGGGVAGLLQAVGGLRQLDYVLVNLRMKLQQEVVQELTGMLQQLLGMQLAPSCAIEPKLLRIDARGACNLKLTSLPISEPLHLCCQGRTALKIARHQVAQQRCTLACPDAPLGLHVEGHGTNIPLACCW
jgi:hypothetical protein